MTTRPKLHLSSLLSLENPTLRKLRDLPPPRGYDLTQHPEEADFVLFAEDGYLGIDLIPRLRELKKQWRGDFFVFSESDWPFALLPGLYPSLTKRLPWAHSWSYVVDTQPMIDPGERPYLFSFLGRSTTHPVRKKVLDLDSKTTPCVDISEAHHRFPDWKFRGSYARLLGQSTFALCPRGFGVSSIRLFEAMRSGCVPVIISDCWIEPPCGNWADFSIRIPESRIDTIPSVCESRLDEARDMGQLAATTYKRYFCADVFLDNAIDVIREYSMHPPRTIIARALSAISLREFRDAISQLKNTSMAFYRGHQA